MSQLTVSNHHHNKLIEQFFALVRISRNMTRGRSIAAPIAATLFAATVAWRYFVSRRKKVAHFLNIPTPKGSNIFIGHLGALYSHSTETFQQWHRELGPIYHFNLGTQKCIVVADPIMTHELFSSMGKITSDRPHEPSLLHDFGGDNTRGIVLGLPNSKAWTTLRKSALNALGPKKIKEANPILSREADEFLELVATGENINPLVPLLRVSLNFILLTVFSLRTTSIEDPLYKKSIEVIGASMNLSDLKNVVSRLIPILKIIDPFIGTRKLVFNTHEKIFRPFYVGLIEKALDADDGNITKALNNELNQGKRGNYANMLHTLNDLLTAGTDTTAVTMAWGFLQISTKPDTQKKIQQEIDDFVNKNGRLPYFWERDELPYMIATQRECMRLRPTTEFGVTHVVAEDFEWRGNIIPKNTWLMSNMLGAHMDPEKYPNPEEFRPERFLSKSETMAASANRNVEDRDQFNFGWGRRICVGTHLAETQMFNVWVRVLHRCNIKPALDKNGVEVPQSLETVKPLSGPIVVSPSPFELRFVPRNKD
ncbi:cytochrome P450 [Phascolomyces articulosus]|uniref:Cytochrome P450 n=1 Tax=Phascolomyces articulosus TaxID=60185 RepID=A0AAD5KRX5_9FUNG|nr:cytochrome P450 [Phascolomyces articulosus]